MQGAKKVTVSGSFHRHMRAIQEAVEAFRDRGVTVLSPADPRVVDEVGPFIFVASDRHRSVRLVEDRHLASIGQSDFLWLVAPDGYVGQSASLELGFAAALRIPVYGEVLPSDLTLGQYVQKVEDLDEALEACEASSKGGAERTTFLVDPLGAAEVAHREVEHIRVMLACPSNRRSGSEVAREVQASMSELNRLSRMPVKKIG